MNTKLSIGLILSVVIGLQVSDVYAGKKKSSKGISYSSGFEIPKTRKETPSLFPLDFTLAFTAGNTDHAFYGLTRKNKRSGKQSLFLNLRSNDGFSDYGACGVIKEIPVNGLEVGQHFLLEAWMAADAGDPIENGSVTIRLEFYGPSMRTLIYRTDEDPDHDFETIDEDNASIQFKRYYVDYTVNEDTMPDPSKVVLLKVVVGSYNAGNTGFGRVLVDDVSLQELFEE